mmetsp:Transcript_42065/g.96426  ORF Transcript_42065/g.96426 Transcript_42065/m.96426 type:complete len:94 (-) Transcript_42065:201-482(-)
MTRSCSGRCASDHALSLMGGWVLLLRLTLATDPKFLDEYVATRSNNGGRSSGFTQSQDISQAQSEIDVVATCKSLTVLGKPPSAATRELACAM